MHEQQNLLSGTLSDLQEAPDYLSLLVTLMRLFSSRARLLLGAKIGTRSHASVLYGSQTLSACACCVSFIVSQSFAAYLCFAPAPTSLKHHSHYFPTSLYIEVYV